MRKGLTTTLLVVLIVLGSACSGESLTPSCRNYSALTLMAQSVPEAAMMPCVDALPIGWDTFSMDIRSGISRFSLNSDRAGLRAVEITLTGECDVGNAIEVPSDEEGARRYEDIDTVQGRFHGTRYYVFDGGCVTYMFAFNAEGRTALVNDMSLAISFRTRAEVAEFLRSETDGRIDLL